MRNGRRERRTAHKCKFEEKMVAGCKLKSQAGESKETMVAGSFHLSVEG
jgi:hypothetical protein